jgi:hypothetical protein
VEWRYEEDISHCTVGQWCAILSSYNDGAGTRYEFIEVGEITAVDKEKRTFSVRKAKPTKDPWSPGITGALWHAQPRRGKADADDEEHASVIKYFKKLKNNKKLPQAVVAAIDERNIKWRET